MMDMRERDNVTVQVIPFTAGAVGNMPGPVTILEFDDKTDGYMVSRIRRRGRAGRE
jgi:hypothetical protein